MARLYCVDIFFQNEQYPSLLSIRSEGHDLYCIVRFMDKRLPYVQAGDTLVINPKEGLKQPNTLPPELAEALANSACKAVQRQ